jgi:hypothetical protein
MTNHVSNSFEQRFLAMSFQAQIARCDEYKRVFLFIALFKDNAAKLKTTPLILCAIRR